MCETVKAGDVKTEEQDKYVYKQEIVWRNVIGFAILHYFGILGLIFHFTRAKWQTNCFALLMALPFGFGATAAQHRLWAHRCFKAKLPLRIMLCIFQTMIGQNHIHEWVRDHRVHHKFTDTDADPHSISRGFFFAHMGWLLVRKHRDVIVKGKTIDMSDIEADAVVMFQKRHYIKLFFLFAVIIPTLIPMYFWNETFYVSFCSVAWRYVISLHVTWSVNSFAHMYGTRPYDKSIKPVENYYVSALAFGEGWHNFHHVFPWDYKAGEFGHYSTNWSAAFLDLMAKIGWAYDLKTVSPEIIRKRQERTGEMVNDEEMHHIWGWNDKDMVDEEKKSVTILYRKTE